MNKKLIALASASLIVQAVPVYSFTVWQFKDPPTSSWHTASNWERLNGSGSFPNTSWGDQQRAAIAGTTPAVISSSDVLFNTGSELRVLTGGSLSVQGRSLQIRTLGMTDGTYGMILSSGATLNIISSGQLLITAAGTATFLEGSNVIVNSNRSGGAISNSGLMRAEGNIHISNISEFRNLNNLIFSGNSSTLVEGQLSNVNSGVITIQDNSTLNINGSNGYFFNQSGRTVHLLDNATLNIEGSMENIGILNLSATASVINSHNITNQGTINSNQNNLNVASINNLSLFDQHTNRLLINNDFTNFETATIRIRSAASFLIAENTTINNQGTFLNQSSSLNTLEKVTILNTNNTGFFRNEGNIDLVDSLITNSTLGSLQNPGFRNSSTINIINSQIVTEGLSRTLNDGFINLLNGGTLENNAFTNTTGSSDQGFKNQGTINIGNNGHLINQGNATFANLFAINIFDGGTLINKDNGSLNNFSINGIVNINGEGSTLKNLDQAIITSNSSSSGFTFIIQNGGIFENQSTAMANSSISTRVTGQESRIQNLESGILQFNFLEALNGAEVINESPASGGGIRFSNSNLFQNAVLTNRNLASALNQNNSIINFSQNSLLNNYGNFNNQGEINVNDFSEIENINGIFFSSGIINLNNSAELRNMGGEFVSSGAINIDLNASLQNSAQFIISETGIINLNNSAELINIGGEFLTSGTINIDLNASLQNSAQFINQGLINLNGSLLNEGVFTIIQGGITNVQGIFDNQINSTLNIQGVFDNQTGEALLNGVTNLFQTGEILGVVSVNPTGVLNFLGSYGTIENALLINSGEINLDLTEGSAHSINTLLSVLEQTNNGVVNLVSGNARQNFGTTSILDGGILSIYTIFNIEGTLSAENGATIENRSLGQANVMNPGLKIQGALHLTNNSILDNLEGRAGNFGQIVVDEGWIRNRAALSTSYSLPDMINTFLIHLVSGDLSNEAGRFLNSGFIQVDGNSLLVNMSSGGGTFSDPGMRNANLIQASGGNVENAQNAYFTNTSVIELDGSAELINYGNMQNLADINADSTSQIVNAAGGLFVNNGAITGTFVNDGLLKGIGSFDTLTGSGTFAFGLSPGVAATNNFIPSAGANLEWELDGLAGCSGVCIAGSSTQYDQLLVNDTLDLTALDLTLTLLFGFTPEIGDFFDIIAYNTFAGGEFNNIIAPLGYVVDINYAYTPSTITNYDYTVRLTILDNGVPIPEPETYLTLGSFLLAAYLLRGKKRALGKVKSS